MSLWEVIVFRIVFYIFIGYLIFQVVRLVILASKVVKNGQGGINAGNKKEKDISRVAKILDEKRPDKKK